MKDLFTVITWPDVQEVMTIEGFDDNSILINDEPLLSEYSSSAYLVRKEWFDRISYKPSQYRVKPILIDTEICSSIIYIDHSDRLFLRSEMDINADLLNEISINKEIILMSLEYETIKDGDIGILYTHLAKQTGYSLGIYSKDEHEFGLLNNQICPIFPKKVVAFGNNLPTLILKRLIDEYNNGGMKDFEIKI